MTVTAAFCPLSLQPLFDQNGCPIRGGMLFAYDAETANARPVYKDAALSSPHPTPVLTDAFGRIPTIWVDVGNYKIVLKDAIGGMLATVDDLPGGVDVEPAANATVTWNTGDLKFAHSDDIQDGWLPLNGMTIGNDASAASARTGVSVQALYLKLWNKDPSLAVSNGRGLTATADWIAGKTLALPDYRGRTIVGADQMGAAVTAGVLTAVTTPTPDQVGAQFGIEATSLSVAQLPTFTPQVTIAASGGHTPAGAVQPTPAHTHTGTTSTVPPHNHGLGGGYSVTVDNGVSGTSYGRASPAQNATDNGGAHLHTFTTDVGGAFSPTFTGTAVPDHIHAATAAPIGLGSVHTNVQPSIVVYAHIKL